MASSTQAITAEDFLTQAEALLAQKGNEQEVIRLLNQSLAIQQSGKAYFYRAYAKYSLGDIEGAISDYNQAIGIKPQDAHTYNFRGIAKYALGDKQGAIADYTQSIAINPKDADSYYNRGNVKDDLGDKKGSIADYNQAIHINPQYYAAYNNRKYVKDDLGYKQEAIAYYSQTIAINPQYADAYYKRGNAKAAQLAEKRRFSRDRWLREWQEWSLDPVTRKALLPISGLLLLGGLTGWFMGTQQFCRPLILQPGVQQLRSNEP